MDCKVTCLGKPGTTFNMVVFDDPYLFRGGSSLMVHEFVGKVLDKIKDDFGRKLFSVEFSAPEVISEDIEDVLEVNKESTLEVQVIPDVTTEESNIKLSDRKQRKIA